MTDGLCLCGCGGTTTIAQTNHRVKGWTRGQPLKYLKGHQAKHRARPWIDRVIVNYATGCWIWTGTQIFGYGYMNVTGTGKMLRMHRYSYEQLVGPIPDGLVLDHLCRAKACVNPAHLEPVTVRENTIRGNIARGVSQATPRRRIRRLVSDTGMRQFDSARGDSSDLGR